MPFKARPHLTVKMINDLQHPAEGKRLEVGDGRVPGLSVPVTPRGVKSFSFVCTGHGAGRSDVRPSVAGLAFRTSRRKR